MSMDLVSNLDVYFKGDRDVCQQKELLRTSFETGGLPLKIKVLDEAFDRLNVSYRTQ